MYVYQSKEACIIYVEQRCYAYLTIEGFFNSEKLKDFSLKIIELCRTEKVSKLLFDSTKLTIIKLDDINWLLKNVIPDLKQQELQKVAFIMPENNFGFVSINRLLCTVDKDRVKLFESFEQAEEWLFDMVDSVVYSKEIL